MASFNVLLDTNVFDSSKYGFKNNVFSSLIKYCANGMAKQYSNSIIINETKRHILKDVDMSARRAKNSIRDRKELINALSKEEYDYIESTLLNTSNKLNEMFDDFIGDATIISNCGLSMDDLFNDYFSENEPFEDNKDKKSEFPDAVIIMSIKKFLLDNPSESLHIVTDDNGWHKALSSTSGVFLYKRLKDLLTEISKEEHELYDKILLFLEKEKDNIIDYVRECIEENEWYNELSQNDFECDEIEEINFINFKTLTTSIEYIDVNDGYASISISGIALFDTSYKYIDHSEEIYDREEHIFYNTKYGTAREKDEVPVDIELTVFLEDNEIADIDPIQYDDVNFSSIHLVSIEYTENDPYKKYYYSTCPDCGTSIGIENDGGNGFCVNCAPNH